MTVTEVNAEKYRIFSSKKAMFATPGVVMFRGLNLTSSVVYMLLRRRALSLDGGSTAPLTAWKRLEQTGKGAKRAGLWVRSRLFFENLHKYKQGSSTAPISD